MTKKELRKIYQEKRDALSVAEQSKLDDLLLIQFQQANLPFITRLFSFWPIEQKKEPNAHLFTDYLEFKNPGLSVAYPRTDFFTEEMLAIATNAETQFVQNEFELYEPEEGPIMEPGEIDMILVPLLAVDKKGYRVGYGKGFYDKYLSACKKDCIKVGFSYFEPVDEIADKQQFDVPLNLCITPQTVYVF